MAAKWRFSRIASSEPFSSEHPGSLRDVLGVDPIDALATHVRGAWSRSSYLRSRTVRYVRAYVCTAQDVIGSKKAQ